MKKRTVLFRIESINGDDQLNVPEDKVVEKINTLTQEGKWSTVEMKDGSSQIITKPVEDEAWKNAFGKPKTEALDAVKINPSDVKSVTSTSKLRGG
jgi:hypothetical protein